MPGQRSWLANESINLPWMNDHRNTPQQQNKWKEEKDKESCCVDPRSAREKESKNPRHHRQRNKNTNKNLVDRHKGTLNGNCGGSVHHAVIPQKRCMVGVVACMPCAMQLRTAVSLHVRGSFATPNTCNTTPGDKHVPAGGCGQGDGCGDDTQ